MTYRIAINGFGRIGRMVARLLLQRSSLELVAVNDLVQPDNLAYLFKRDSIHGVYPEQVSSDENSVTVGKKKIAVFNEKNPEKLPWKSLNIDYVVESTGCFTSVGDAKKHIYAGAKRVVITAPGKDGTATFVMGVNHTDYNPASDTIISNASCTTNCLAPVCKVLLDHFGIEEGLMTTVHALTISQSTVDSPSKRDFRIGRAAGFNIIPATTGAAKAVSLCLPELKDKLTGMAFRVPIADVSVVDLSVRLKKDTTYKEICDLMDHAAKHELKGILDTTDEPVVSSDFIGSPFSSIFDKGAGTEVSPRFYKLIAWYDNEMGYSHRTVDLLEYMAKQEK